MTLIHGKSEPPVLDAAQSSRSTRASKQSLGALGEQMAARYLEMHGMRMLARNWRHRFGELDLVAVDGTTLVAIEVKTRSSTAFGHPLEAITAAKFGRLKALLAIWASAHESRYDQLRVDAVGIVLGKPGQITIDHRAGIA